MSVPTPPTSLDNSCSVIYGNTLYSYSPLGLLSLPLQQGANWTELATGVSVTGATCVGSTPSDASQAGLYVVGGVASSDDSYTGLQKFTYATGDWTTITPSDQVTKNRQWHGSTYIQADDVILVYAGSQNGEQSPSTQTFTIQASAPYAALSYASIAPPAVYPIVMSWSAADAAVMSGDGTSGDVYWFNPTALMRYSGASLAQPPLTTTGSENAILMDGDDGSKSLYIFNLGQSPNQVSRVVVQNAAGAPVANAAAVAARSLEGAREKRDLTVQDWPAYNNSLAPTITRQDFAMAQGSNGLVVFTGGNTDDSISVFNATSNSWVNTTVLLTDPVQKVLATSSTTTSQPTSTTSISTSSLVSSTTQTAASGPSVLAVPPIPTTSSSASSGPTANEILGITLGTIAGFLALLGLILFLLRRRKGYQNQKHAEAGQAKGASGPPSDEKDTTAFASSVLPPPPSPGHFRGHNHTMSQESTSSMAILMGRVGHKARKPSNDTTQSLKGTTGNPQVQAQASPALHAQDEKGMPFSPTVAESGARNGPMDAQDGTRRSSGWNRYWSGGSALQILGFGASKRDTITSDSSRYSQGTNNPRHTRDLITMPAPNFEGCPEMSRVRTGSPVVSSCPTRIPWQDGMSGKIERPVSSVSALSSGYSSGIPESIHEAWDPTEAGKPWGTDRAPSSVYAPTTLSAPPRRPPPAGSTNEAQLAMESTSNDMSWLNLGDQSRA